MRIALQHLSIRSLVVVLALTSACIENGPKEPPALVIVSGSNQKTLPGGQIVRPLVVRAQDAQGNPRPNILVGWTGTGGSKFETDTSRTNADGIAVGIWTVGSTTGSYSASAMDGTAGYVTFKGEATNDALIISAQPSTLSFSALGDSTQVWLRVQSKAGDLDTLMMPIQAGWSGSSIGTVFWTNTRKFFVRSVKKGTQSIWMSYTNPPQTNVSVNVTVDPFTAGQRLVTTGSVNKAPDTIFVAKDSAFSLSLVEVDANNWPVEGRPPITNATWQSSNTSVASVNNGAVQSLANGSSIVSASTAFGVSPLTVQVWSFKVASASAGGGTSCAVTTTQALVCWGQRAPGSTGSPGNALAPELRPGTFVTYAQGEAGGCGVNSAGDAYCNGTNQSGSLGNGSFGTNYTLSPQLVSGGLTFTTAARGGGASCGLTTAGKAYCWGSGFDGALGDGTYGLGTCVSNSGCSTTPVAVSGNLTFKQLSVGQGGHHCGIAVDDHAYCWGANRYRQLGSPLVACTGYAAGSFNGDSCSRVPVELDSNRTWKDISAGVSHVCAVSMAGELFCGGSNIYGVLGSLNATAAFSIPNPLIRVAPGTTFKRVFSGRQHTCAIDAADDAWCWGSGFAGQLGSGSSITTSCNTSSGCAPEPVKVTGGLKWSSLTLGVSHTCGLTTGSVLYCWGSGFSGNIGDGSTTQTNHSPRKVAFQDP